MAVTLQAVWTNTAVGLDDNRANIAMLQTPPVAADLCSLNTLGAIRRHLRPGGQALIGDSIWEGAPSASALAARGVSADAYPGLAGLVRAFHEYGFEPSYGHVSTLAEWDDYQFSWAGSLVDWAVWEASTTEDRDQAFAAARENRDAWLSGARGELGFATFVLHDVAVGVRD